MARPNRIKFKSRGFRQILVGGGTLKAVSGAAYSIRSKVPGAAVRTKVGGYGGGRVIAFVVTKPKTAEEAESQREALEAAVHGA